MISNYKDTVAILSFKEVCELLGICRNTLTKMMNNNEIKYCKLGTQYKFRYCDIMSLFDYNNRAGYRDLCRRSFFNGIRFGMSY